MSNEAPRSTQAPRGSEVIDHPSAKKIGESVVERLFAPRARPLVHTSDEYFALATRRRLQGQRGPVPDVQRVELGDFGRQVL